MVAITRLDLDSLPLFVPGELLAELEQAEARQGLSPLQRLWQVWALRQRDSARAEQLAQALAADIALVDWTPAQRQLALARLQLVQAEAALLAMDIERAAAQQTQALQQFQALDHALGCADARWLAHYLEEVQGRMAASRAELRAAIAEAQRAGDAERLLLMRASLARSELFRDAAAAQAEFEPLLPAGTAGLSPACAAALADYQGLRAGLAAEYLQSIALSAQAYEWALQTGQLRRALGVASNLGHSYTRMADYQSAGDWLRRSLELARAARWPTAISFALAQSGDALRCQGQADAARELLQEALQIEAARPGTRTHALALKYLAQTEQDQGRHAQALQAFEALAAQVGDSSVDLRIDAELGRARALLALEQPAAALALLAAALPQARQQRERGVEVEMLWVQAGAQRALGDGAAAHALLQQALQGAAQVPDYQPPALLLDDAAESSAAAGDWPAAYRLARRSSALRQRSFSEESSRRTAALHAHHQIERARAESEHLRRLAESEAARFEALQDAHQALLHLGAIGQEITTQLDAPRIFEVLERHVHALLQADSLAVYLLDDTGTELVCAFGMEAGEAFLDPPIAVADNYSYSARCVRERRAFILGEGGGEGVVDAALVAEAIAPQAQIPGTGSVRSVMFAPLMVAERVIGVMTVQTPRAAAYGQREQLIFRNLCAYGAIALDNARAYRRLSELQRHMMAQEKLAALGAMVAGVAHELNTPIGNSLLVASSLLSRTQEFEGRVARQALRRSDWADYASQSRQGLEVIERSMETAAALVRSFKQVAVDRSAEQRRGFGLAELCEQCAQTMSLSLRRAGLQLDLAVPRELRLESFPGALSQVLVILLNNAMTHAFEGREGGRLLLGAESLGPERLRLWLQDDGVGMNEAVLARIFEPFFSTKFGQGGSGLGLSICHNIVETLLGGKIRASSQPGAGSRFSIELPLRAPG